MAASFISNVSCWQHETDIDPVTIDFGHADRIPRCPVSGAKRKTFARVAEVLSVANNYLPNKISIVIKGLTCIKEVEGYKQMNASERKEAMRGAFRTGYNWNNNDILLVDDVYTHG